jgi:hypothetical protein
VSHASEFDGRWTSGQLFRPLRIRALIVLEWDISKALKSEGVDISPTQVHGILRDLGLSYKRPKLDIESDDPSYARKERELNHYEQVAPALAKGG